MRLGPALFFASLALAACGGGGGGGGQTSTTPTPAPIPTPTPTPTPTPAPTPTPSPTPAGTFTVGGFVSGLNGNGLKLSNGGEELNIVANGAFKFNSSIAGGASYNVTVTGKPTNPSQTCSVTGGAGTISNANVQSIQITCTVDLFSLGGTVTSLTGSGLVLTSGTGQTVTINAPGPFVFPNRIASGTGYNIRVIQQPFHPAQDCAASLSSVSGGITNSDITSIEFKCVIPRAPPVIGVCDEPTCGGAAPTSVRVCPTSQPNCTPSRSTKIVYRLDHLQIDSGLFTLNLPSDQTVIVDSGPAIASGSIVQFGPTSYVQLSADAALTLTYYGVAPVWGGTTFVDFESFASESTNIDSIFYRHSSYPSGTAAADLQAHAVGAATEEIRITSLPPPHMRAMFIPTELITLGEGNLSFGDGRVTINYGNPPYLAAIGGILNASIPRFAHEYTHELFAEVSTSYNGDSSCLNEGIADALAYKSGYLPEADFGPVGLQGLNFETDGCIAQKEGHDIGNCPLWHIKIKNQLTESFLYGLFHPQHNYNFGSCSLANTQTGNSLFVLFTEAAGGADVRPALDAAGVPHAATYSEAKAALGF